MALIEIFAHTEKSYQPIVSFEHWRVALMNDMEKYLPHNIAFLQKHNESDESFVLLKGKCTLYVAEGGARPGRLIGYPMEPLKVYNIKKGVWHTHAFAPDTQVLIVENSNTCDENSPKFFEISPQQRDDLIQQAGF